MAGRPCFHPQPRLASLDMRRPKGEAAELIVKALTLAKPDALGINDLLVHTGLPIATLRDNVKALRKQGKVETFKDDQHALWVSLPE